jgi:hypothetical protein
MPVSTLRAAHVRYVMDNVALEEVSPSISGFPFPYIDRSLWVDITETFEAMVKGALGLPPSLMNN